MLDIFAEQTHTVNVLVLDFLAEVSIYYSEFIPKTILKDNSVYTQLKIQTGLRNAGGLFNGV